MEEKISKVVIHYLKSQSFETVKADGVYGGATPNLELFLAFFSERPAIPETVVYTIQDDGNLGKQIGTETKTKSGLIREVHTGIIVNRATALKIRDWIDDMVKRLDKASQPTDESQELISPDEEIG